MKVKSRIHNREHKTSSKYLGTYSNRYSTYWIHQSSPNSQYTGLFFSKYYTMKNSEWKVLCFLSIFCIFALTATCCKYNLEREMFRYFPFRIDMMINANILVNLKGALLQVGSAGASRPSLRSGQLNTGGSSPREGVSRGGIERENMQEKGRKGRTERKRRTTAPLSSGQSNQLYLN